MISSKPIKVKMKNLSITDQWFHANLLSSRLGGSQSRNAYNGHSTFKNIQCPCCGKKKAVMYVADNNYTFLLKCPVYGCSLQDAVTLNTAINDYAKELLSEWNRSIGKNPTWGGIQNRRPRGKSQKSNSDKSFQAEMEKNAIRQQVRMMMDLQSQKDEKFKTF
jgi:hypothetical protein